MVWSGKKMEPEWNHQKAAWVFFLLILLTGTILRAYHLGDAPYSLDELFSIKHASLPFMDIISNVDNEPHPPFYYILLHFWMGIFGSSEIATRSLSVLFGVVSIYLMWCLGTLLFNRETGLIASLILAISSFHIRYSQESRMYSLMVMLTLVSMYFFVKMQGGKDHKYYPYYLISSTLLLYSHIYGIFIILAQNFYVAIILFTSLTRGKNIRKSPAKGFSIKNWIVLQSILFVVFIPWLLVLGSQIMGVNDGSFVNLNWLPETHLSDIPRTFLLFASYEPLTLALFFLLSISAFIVWKRSRRDSGMQNSNPLTLLSLWMVVPILVPFVLSLWVFPMYYPKYAIAASLALFLLASKGISNIKSKKLKGSILMLLVYLSATSIYYAFMN